jgi:DNA-binding NtrC family response regulator
VNETSLLHDDDAAVRECEQDILLSHGYQILWADSGKKALDVWEKAEGKIDLLLTDMIMTDGITGRVLADRLRFQKPALKVILASGYSGEIIDHDWAEREGIEFLAKPFASHTLTRKVRECLDKR